MGCTWRSAPCSARGLQGGSLFHCGPLLDYREQLLCAWSTSCSPSALTSVPKGPFLFIFSLFHPSCSCLVFFFSFLKSALPEAQRALLTAQLWPVTCSFWSQTELALNSHGAASVLCSQQPPLQSLCPPLPQLAKPWCINQWSLIL